MHLVTIDRNFMLRICVGKYCSAMPSAISTCIWVLNNTISTGYMNKYSSNFRRKTVRYPFVVLLWFALVLQSSDSSVPGPRLTYTFTHSSEFHDLHQAI